jgi:tetratricopeptide (TPR) repeat protein
MKAYILTAFALIAVGCTANPTQVSQNANSTGTQPSSGNERPQTVTAHTTENQPPKLSNSGGPSSAPYKSAAMGDPIDTAKFDGTIAAAEKIVKSKPSDEAAKKTLADAYFDRGFALTEARQYASALGDYRRALKLDPNHEESKKWLNQIVSIYEMLKKDAPKEGEEPPPLPFKKPA